MVRVANNGIIMTSSTQTRAHSPLIFLVPSFIGFASLGLIEYNKYYVLVELGVMGRGMFFPNSKGERRPFLVKSQISEQRGPFICL